MQISWRTLLVRPMLSKKDDTKPSQPEKGLPIPIAVPNVARYGAHFDLQNGREPSLAPDPHGRYMLYDDYRAIVIATQNEVIQNLPKTLIQMRTRQITWGLLILVLLGTGVYASFHGFKPYLLGASAGVALIMVLNPERRRA